MAGQRPLPRFPEPDTESFWEATKQHEPAYKHSTRNGNPDPLNIDMSRTECFSILYQIGAPKIEDD